MKTTPDGHGGTIPGDLRDDPPRAIQRKPRDLSEAEKRSIRRHAADMVHSNGGYKIWAADDGKLYTEPLK